MSTSFYTREELSKIGLKSYGDNVLISRKEAYTALKNFLSAMMYA